LGNEPRQIHKIATRTKTVIKQRQRWAGQTFVFCLHCPTTNSFGFGLGFFFNVEVSPALPNKLVEVENNRRHTAARASN